MNGFLAKKPSLKLTWFLLLAGLLIFVPIYISILSLFADMKISYTEYTGILLSFDKNELNLLIQQLMKQSTLSVFITSYKLNIVSLIGFLMSFFALTLIIARKFDSASRLYRAAYSFPLVVIVIAILDIFASIVLLFALSGPAQVSDGITLIFSCSYVIRSVMLVILIIWLSTASVSLVIKRITRK